MVECHVVLTETFVVRAANDKQLVKPKINRVQVGFVTITCLCANVYVICTSFKCQAIWLS